MPYSLINIIANKTLEYSTLNPETSSDSPSEKSKGVRLVSAIALNSHSISKGHKNKRFKLLPYSNSVKNFKLLYKINKFKRINASLISYEIA